VVTEFVIPTPDSHPYRITTGRDGNLWFTENSANQIGRLTTGGTFTEFAIPTNGPQDIVSGPDGNLWFTEPSASRIGTITTAGAFGEFPIPTAGSYPVGITSGPDGNLWFTEYFGNNIGQITPAGVVREFPVTSAVTDPYGITTGPDRNVWFTEGAGNRIGRVVPTASSALVLPSAPVPAAVAASRGASVLWTFLGPGTHSVTDTSGMGLFASGPRSFVSYYTFRFVSAGTYKYEDTANTVTGTVKVPVGAKPSTGSTSTSFNITWAAAAPPSGYVFDVQIKPPGSASYVSWSSGVTSLSASFKPTSGVGTYSFRARLRKTASGAASGYSAGTSITVS
jgi:sugar lactone lactonase YvrE